VVLRTPAPLGRARYLATNKDTLGKYFDLLEKALEENKLMDKPCQIYNMDETGMPLSPKPLKVLDKCGTKNPSVFTSPDKSQVTVVGCVNASGHCIPPMVIWDRKNLNPELAIGEVPGTIYGLSSKGWMDMELFDLWFKRHFLRYCPATRPILLLMDGHSSHYCLDTIKQAAEDDIVIFVLPPNTTHLVQPLDKGIFGPLKISWRETCHKYLLEHPGRVITRYDFSKLFSKAWMKAMTMKNIRSGFATTGIFPLNRNAVSLPISEEPKSKKVSFIPIYTPSKQRPLETEVFEKCYDLSKDIEYKKWLRVYHPDDLSCPESEEDDMYHPVQHQSSLKMFLQPPSLPKKLAVPDVTKSARVLTNSENLQILEAKQKEKEEKDKKGKKKKSSSKSPKGIIIVIYKPFGSL
jgi:hypothetical protein